MRRERGLFNCRVEGRMRLTTLPGLTAIILALSGGGLAKPKQPISVHLNAADVVYSPVALQSFIFRDLSMVSRSVQLSRLNQCSISSQDSRIVSLALTGVK